MIYEKLVFTKKECDLLVNYCLTEITPEEIVQTKNINYSHFKIQYKEELNWLFSKLYNTFHELTGVKVKNQTNHLSINRYQVGNSFSKHIDRNENTPNRIWNMGIILNDDYEGGDYNYFVDGEKKTFSKVIGNMIIYDSSVPHEVTKVTKGVRFALVKILDIEHITTIKNSLI